MRSPAWASTSAWPRRWTRCCWSMAWCRRGISSRTQSIGAAGNGTHCRPAMAWPRSSTLQEPQIERCEHQDYSDVHHQPFPEPVPEEQDVHADNDGYQREHVKHDDCLSSHPAFLVRAGGVEPAPRLDCRRSLSRNVRFGSKADMLEFCSPTNGSF